jgi:hypothetical protein
MRSAKSLRAQGFGAIEKFFAAALARVRSARRAKVKFSIADETIPSARAGLTAI